MGTESPWSGLHYGLCEVPYTHGLDATAEHAGLQPRYDGLSAAGSAPDGGLQAVPHHASL